MQTIGWRFPELRGGARQGYTNNDIEGFKGQELMDNLAREICQNSLDAKVENSTEPVRVVFERKTVKKDDYRIFTEYQACLARCRQYWQGRMDIRLDRFLTGAEKTINNDTIELLIASDYNTNGLTGIQKDDENSPWGALTQSEGVSAKNSLDSAGSYGIGKNAPFAASPLSLVCYNTLTIDGESAFVGVSRLATMYDEKGEETQRTGKYQKNDNEAENWEPIYPADTDAFRDYFARTEYGTDVIIAGFSQGKGWTNSFTKAVLSNFFVAIKEKNLVVQIKDGDTDIVIDDLSIGGLFRSYANDHRMAKSIQLYDAFTTAEKTPYTIYEPEDYVVYAKCDNSFDRVIANFRSTGMKVGSYYKQIPQRYAAVVVIRGEQLGALLKETEPPRHNNWDPKKIDNIDDEGKKRRKEATRVIDVITNTVKALLTSQTKIDTSLTVDAVGMGEYLPADERTDDDNAAGDDLLRAKIKVAKPRTQRTPQGFTTEVAVWTSGEEVSGAGANGGHPHNGGHSIHPHPGTEPGTHTIDPNIPSVKRGNNKLPGVSPGRGSTLERTPKLAAQRAIPVNSSSGLYRIIIIPTEDYDNLYVKCKAVGEDGKSDALEMKVFKQDRKTIPIKDGVQAGPIQVRANQRAEFYVTFVEKGKFMLQLSLTEVRK